MFCGLLRLYYDYEIHVFRKILRQIVGICFAYFITYFCIKGNNDPSKFWNRQQVRNFFENYKKLKYLMHTKLPELKLLLLKKQLLNDIIKKILHI